MDLKKFKSGANLYALYKNGSKEVIAVDFNATGLLKYAKEDIQNYRIHEFVIKHSREIYRGNKGG